MSSGQPESTILLASLQGSFDSCTACFQHQLCVLQVDGGNTSECAAMYSLGNNTFVPYHVAELPICGGHTLLPDGRVLIVGGKYFQLTHRLASSTLIQLQHACLH